jgi:uncharacterized lipoprotein NlpE involved in copper resistance
MKYTSLLLSGCLIALCISCQNNNGKTEHQEHEDSITVHDEHTSQTSLDWAGTYQDTIPCADCSGILTTIKLYENGNYTYNAEYLERNTTLQDSGQFMWHDNGSVVHLKGKNVDTKYKVGENTLYQTDTEGKVIEGEMAEKYTLHKVF